MKRTLVSVVLIVSAATAAAAMPSPAAGESTTFEGTAQGAGASWERVRDLPSGGFRVRIWSVWAYVATDGSEASLVRETISCNKHVSAHGREAREYANGTKRRRPDCALEDIRAGVATLPSGAFTMDAAGMTAAHVDASITIRHIGERGRPFGRGVTKHVVADWVGRGERSIDSGTFHHEDPSCVFTDEFSDTTRGADATGTIGDKDMGQTSFAELVLSSFKSTTEGCEDFLEFGPLSARRPA